MNSNHECPYCNAKQEHVNDEPFEQDEVWDEECSSCGKTYRLHGWYEENYRAEKADCLNGDVPHNFVQIMGLPKEHFIGKFRCSVCSKKEDRGGSFWPEY